MNKKSILNEIKSILFGSEEDMKFKEAKSGDFILRVNGDDFAEGQEISLVTADGLIPVEDGVYPLEDGRILNILAGKINKIEGEIKEEEEEEKPEIEIELAETELLDGTKVKVEGDVAIGSKVMVDKDGEWIQAPEGQHNLADGKVIYVDAEGMINEIETPDTKKVEEEMEAVVEAPAYVDETAGMTSSIVEEKMGDMEKRIEELEKKIEEMGKVNMEVANFSKNVENKLDTFIKETPADLEFKSLKSDFSSYVEKNKDTKTSNLEAIKNIRSKK